MSWDVCPPTWTGIEPTAPALPDRPRIERAVQHHAAADERADEEIEEIGVNAAVEMGEFGAARRCRVVREHRRQACLPRDLGGDVDGAPIVERPRRRGDFAGPFPDFEGHGDADADEPFAML